MVDDIDIFRVAKQLVDQHDDLASFEAAQRVDEMLERGDMGGRRIWLRVLDAVRILLKEVPGANDSVH